NPLRLEDVDVPRPGEGELLVRIEACACCRTDLHVIEGDLPPVKLPVIPGHQITGKVAAMGPNARLFRQGQRVGVAWLRHVDGTCRYCLEGRENLCPNARFTGYMADGGYAEYATVDEDFAYQLPEELAPEQAAPLLCAGIIGYRALKRSEIRPGGRLGIFGFGGSAHVTIQVALHWGCEVYVATRGEMHATLAQDMGASWVGQAEDLPPAELDAAILFAPVGRLVPVALKSLGRGATLALAGIYMSEIPPLAYERDLFYERSLRSVTANTRRDGRELLTLAAEIPIRSRVTTFALADVNAALHALKHDAVSGAAVVKVGD
ncbi:MAG TPA: zinc-dependent alcohol dehydrogenase family protein, partial [Chloroflexota bacterium]|nr:zinc-dependent alcohol dehydrogenase family protein [Chloroflexota bacterium]